VIHNGEAIETSYAILGDPIDVSADELVRVMDTKETAIERARKFLRGLLVDGPMKAKEIMGLAQDQGIVERTLYTAKRDLNVDSFRKHNVWWWVLPENDGPAEPGEPEEESE
jgi:putative DNA primase/helicase